MQIVQIGTGLVKANHAPGRARAEAFGRCLRPAAGRRSEPRHRKPERNVEPQRRDLRFAICYLNSSLLCIFHVGFRHFLHLKGAQSGCLNRQGQPHPSKPIRRHRMRQQGNTPEGRAEHHGAGIHQRQPQRRSAERPAHCRAGTSAHPSQPPHPHRPEPRPQRVCAPLCKN